MFATSGGLKLPLYRLEETATRLIHAPRPRILQLCAVDFTAFHFLQPLMEGCREAGWDVEFACSAGPGALSLEQSGFRFRRFDVSRRPSPTTNGPALVRFAVALRRDRPTVVHTHTPVAGVVGRLAAQLAGCQRVVHTFHGLPFTAKASGLSTATYLALERLAARRTDYFFSQSRGDADRAVKLGIARERDLLVIGNGVDLRRFTPDASERRRVREELAMRDSDVVVLFVGRLVREKGILDLADAAVLLKDLPDVSFVVAGDPLASDRDPVGTELDGHPVVEELGTRWRRLGYRADIDRIVKAADILVLPSYREGLPRSVIEAMACAIPVIASDIPACRELIDPGDTGLLFQPGERKAIAAAIRSLATNPGRRKGMGNAARARAESRHDERVVIAQQVQIYQRLL